MMQSKEILLSYYQQELEFLRKFSQQFARAHPAIAGNLISNNSDTDPFTDRLIEAIALLNARNHLKLDAEFSETCANLLECIAPNSFAPIPAMSIAQFTPETNNHIVHVPRQTVLTSFTPLGEPCHFTTGYDVECCPLRITQASLNTGALPLTLNIPSNHQSYLFIKLDNLVEINFKQIRFFINAQRDDAYMLYALLFKHTQKIILADNLDDKNPVFLDKDNLKSEGFDIEQSLLLHHQFQNREQLLLSEFFHCPEKFLFFSLNQLEKLSNTPSAYIFILFDTVNHQLASHLTSDFLALNCTPIVNIFPTTSEPITINHTQNEYLLKARLNHHPMATEIYQIQQVSAYNHQNQEVLFKSYYHPTPDIHHFYHPIRRGSPRSEIWLAFSTDYPDLFYNQEWIATAEILCTNRHLVKQLAYGGNLPHFSFEDKTYQTDIINTKILIPFTASHTVSLEHENIIHRLLSILSIGGSPQFFLNLHNTFITQLDCRFAQRKTLNGTDIVIQIDTERTSQSQAFFFCSVLERYFAFQAEINAYTSLVWVNAQHEEIYRWSPRCGESEFST